MENGNGTATCQREGCGKSHTHTLDEGEVTKKSSYEDTGVKTYHCKEADCNYVMYVENYFWMKMEKMR